MMALHENETKYNVMDLLDHEMGYDDTMHHTLDWDWDRNSSHTGLIEAPLMSDNPEYLRDEVGSARGANSDNEEALLSAQNS